MQRCSTLLERLKCFMDRVVESALTAVNRKTVRMVFLHWWSTQGREETADHFRLVRPAVRNMS
jgi:hypothetical protein